MAAILGVSAFYHDSAAALVIDGKIIAAAQEERFTRKKHDPGFPQAAIDYVLQAGGVTLQEVDFVVFYDKPFLKFERLLETYIACAPKGFNSFRMAMPIWLKEKLFLKSQLVRELKKRDENFSDQKLMFSEHHLSHAASAFYPSPFEEAIVVTLDGVGEWATTTVAIGKGNELDIIKEIHFPHSLGLLYSAVTYYLGFRVNSGEYKVMGLAPYGEPKYEDIMLEHLVDLKQDGSFRLDQTYFNYATGLTMTNQKFSDLFGQPVRKPDTDKLTQFHMDMAASVQAVIEKAVLSLVRNLSTSYDIENLCLAGGVALNCVANGKLLRDKAFKNIWVQPAAGDAGGALGAALAYWHKEANQPRTVISGDSMQGSYLGPEYSQDQIEAGLAQSGAIFKSYESLDELIDIAAQGLADGKAVGWFQGRMEFGPRALGGRSILGDPRLESMQKTLNLKVKYRESFRPFAPSVLREHVSDWFDFDADSPYMLMVGGVRENKRTELNTKDEALFGIEKLNVKRSDIPAVTHVDYSARIQTVHADTNPRYHALISSFNEKTACPVVVNTSFNVRGEPIVCTPQDAFRCFMGTEIEMLVIGNSVLLKSDQDASLKEAYQDKFELD
jgi:carbamoyltransferase